jgi:DNA processing protein
VNVRPPGSMRRPSDLRKETVRRPPREESLPPNSWPLEFARRPEDRRALFVLLSLASVTARRLLSLACRVRTASACLDAVRAGEGASNRDVERARTTRWEDVADRLDRTGGRLIAVHDPEYPRELLDLFDPPAGVFVVGGRLDQWPAKVAVVGARNSSAGGRELSGIIGRGLARQGACVVSGGARGIDAAAHRGALDAGGPTICVLASGLDAPYPPKNRELVGAISKHGAVVTEYTPGTSAEPFRFPARNRLVAALARAVVVVEGAAGSGSTITADHALDLGRDVFAVPGAPTSPLSAVPLQLIRDGATLIRGPADLLEDLGMAPPEGDATENTSSTTARLPLVDGSVASDAERRVWNALDNGSPADVVATKTGMPLSQVISALSQLELHGLVRLAGGRYERRHLAHPGP